MGNSLSTSMNEGELKKKLKLWREKYKKFRLGSDSKLRIRDLPIELLVKIFELASIGDRAFRINKIKPPSPVHPHLSSLRHKRQFSNPKRPFCRTLLFPKEGFEEETAIYNLKATCRFFRWIISSPDFSHFRTNRKFYENNVFMFMSKVPKTLNISRPDFRLPPALRVSAPEEKFLLDLPFRLRFQLRRIHVCRSIYELLNPLGATYQFHFLCLQGAPRLEEFVIHIDMSTSPCFDLRQAHAARLSWLGDLGHQIRLVLNFWKSHFPMTEHELVLTFQRFGLDIDMSLFLMCGITNLSTFEMKPLWSADGNIQFSRTSQRSGRGRSIMRMEELIQVEDAFRAFSTFASQRVAGNRIAAQ